MGKTLQNIENQIKNLKIGAALMWAGENHFLFKADCSEYEKNLIEK